MSPKHAPRRQETARLKKNRCFGERCQKRFWSSKITPKLPLGNSGTPLDQPWKILKFSMFDKIRTQKSLIHLAPNFPRQLTRSGGLFGSWLNFQCAYMRRGWSGSIEFLENVSKIGSLGGLLVHGARSPDLPHPGFLKNEEMEKECFAPCRSM